MVAREESVTKAANLLHITQPTLSRQLMQLEEELGVKLFIRNKKHILLTEEGMLLRRRAEEIVTLSEKTREELSHSKEDLSGKINIGSGELRTSLFLAELIISFKKLHPLVEFEIYSGNADNIKERIESGILDIGLLQEPVDISKYVKDVNVNVQIVNYKITMMGEVSRPGTVQVYNDRITILDALGRVGDLTINANRKNILVIRDNDGQKEFGRLDVTNPSVFSSPFFYLRQNDVVYVEPNDAKKRNARYSQAQQYSISVFSSILSAISVITSVIIAITR